MRVHLPGHPQAFLHTSPEYGMKRLLSLGIGNIFQLSHVFREGEHGPLHNPEFTMVEWYRTDCTFSVFQEETLAFMQLFLGEKQAERISYRDALLTHAKIDYTTANTAALLSCAGQFDLALPAGAEEW